MSAVSAAGAAWSWIDVITPSGRCVTASSSACGPASIAARRCERRASRQCDTGGAGVRREGEVGEHLTRVLPHRMRASRHVPVWLTLRTTSERLADLQPGSCLAVEAGAAAGLTRRACGSQPPDYAGPYASRATGHQNMPLCSRIVVITTTNALGRTALKPLRAPGGSAGLGSGRVRRGSEGGDRRAGRDEAARQRRGQEGPDQGFGGV